MDLPAGYNYRVKSIEFAGHCHLDFAEDLGARHDWVVSFVGRTAVAAATFYGDVEVI